MRGVIVSQVLWRWCRACVILVGVSFVAHATGDFMGFALASRAAMS